jgi:hypothetical protein
VRLKHQIADLRRALAVTEDRLVAMAAALGPDQCPCCVGAAYGGTIGPYDRMLRKQMRQEGWLRVLLARQGKDPVELAKASKAYGEITARSERYYRR